MSLVLLLAFLSLLMLALGVVLLRRGYRQAKSERVMGRLRGEQYAVVAKRQTIGGLQRVLLQAGLNLPGWVFLCILLVFLLLMSLVYLLLGGWIVLVIVLLSCAATHLLLRLRYQSRVARMISQMPALLDHVIRSLKSGRTLGDAMMLAMDRCQNPLRDALAGSRRSIELGVALGDVTEEFAELYAREEFHILSVGIKVNQQYGGNASELLESLIVMIRDRERAARQLSALTGETRISALVLGILPIGLAAYILVSNPDFFLGLWNDPTGQTLLYAALALQLCGCYLLWRMMRSI